MSVYAFSETPLAVLAANADVIFANPDMAPRTTLAFMQTSDTLDPARAGSIWAAHAGDADRVHRIARLWAAHVAMIPLSNVISGAKQPVVVDKGTEPLVARDLVPVPIALLATLPTLSAEVNERADFSQMPMVKAPRISIDPGRVVERPTLGELLGMLSGANMGRPSADPRFSCVGVRLAEATADLVALAPVVEKTSGLAPSACCAGIVDGVFDWVGVPTRIATMAAASTAKTTTERQSEIGRGRVF